MFRRTHRGSSWLAVLAALGLLLVAGAVWVAVFADFQQASVDPKTSSGAASATSSSPSSSASGGASQEDGWSMGDARTALSAPDSRVLVLGDSTGDHPEEWVHQWAATREMPVAAWRTQSEDGYDGETPETRVWSGSMPGSTADYFEDHDEAIWPEQDPDLVILNYGHNYDSPEAAVTSMEALRGRLTEAVPEAPIVVTLQNPQADDANAPTREAIADWAKEQGLPTIDVAKAFTQSLLLPEDLRVDSLHPSLAGTEVWVAAVSKALGD